MLQMIKHFTIPGNQPRRGIVFLFNGAEEDGLLGSKAFGNSPLLPFVHTFVNLEGAGAGGKALLFRTTDLQVTQAYRDTPHPFGNVVADNAYQLGWIRSRTDYQVFRDVYGQRGLDIAFYKPRNRYHTRNDDIRHTSKASIWHMLSAGISTVENLASDPGNIFDGERGDGDKDKPRNGRGTGGVWFDILGRVFVVFDREGLFAWALCLLVASPVVLVLLTWILVRVDRYYFFSYSVKLHDEDVNGPFQVGGWRGFFRFPIGFVAAVMLTFGSAMLVRKYQPFTVYSSKYTV